MPFGFQELLLVALFTAIGATVCAVRAQSASHWFKRVALLMVACILLAPGALILIALKPEIIDPRTRTYKRFYSDIQVGMTRAEVLQLVSQRYPEEGERKPPKIYKDHATELGFFMNPEQYREPNCEAIILLLANDRVTKKRYSRD